MKGLRVAAKVYGERGIDLNRSAIDTLGAWGGMDYSINPDENGYGAVSFDLNTVRLNGPGDGEIARIATVIDWLDMFKADYTITFHRWLLEENA